MPARAPNSKHPVVEGIKIVLGGAAGLAIATMLLWWIWGRDPFHLFGGDRVVAEADPPAAVWDPPPAPETDSWPPAKAEPATSVASRDRETDESKAKTPAPPHRKQPPRPGSSKPSPARPEPTPPPAPLSPPAAELAKAPERREPAEAKAVPPNAQTQETTAAKIRDIFRADYEKAESPEQKLQLAETLAAQAKQLEEDPDAHFVVLREAYDLALQAGRLDRAERYVDAMDAAFAIERERVRLHMLATLAEAARTNDERRRLAEVALRYANEAILSRQYESAAAMADVADPLAMRARDGELRKSVQAVGKEARRLRDQSRLVQEMKVRLEKNPADAEASLVYGRHLCLDEGDWEQGLPLLAQGSDAALREAAEQDLEDPADAEARIELADRWYEIAESDAALENFFARAAYWYAAAHPAAEGLKKLKAKTRLAEIEARDLKLGDAQSWREFTAPRAKSGETVAVQLRATLTGHAGELYSVAISPDDRLAASAGEDKEIRIWDAATGRPVRTLAGHASWIWSVDFSPDGAWLASSGGFEKTSRLWRLADGELIATLTGHTGKLRTIAFSPTAPWLASASDDHTIRVWDVPSGRESRTFTPVPGRLVLSLAVSPDGRMIAAGSGDTTVRILDAETGRQLQSCEGHTNGVWFVAWAPDGRRVASTTKDQTVRMWDASTGRELWRYDSPHENSSGVTFTPDGRWLAAGIGAAVQFLDAETGQPAFAAEGHEDSVRGIAFSSDGATMATVSLDQTVRLWDVSR